MHLAEEGDTWRDDAGLEDVEELRVGRESLRDVTGDERAGKDVGGHVGGVGEEGRAGRVGQHVGDGVVIALADEANRRPRVSRVKHGMGRVQPGIGKM